MEALHIFNAFAFAFAFDFASVASGHRKTCRLSGGISWLLALLCASFGRYLPGTGLHKFAGVSG